MRNWYLCVLYTEGVLSGGVESPKRQLNAHLGFLKYFKRRMSSTVSTSALLAMEPDGKYACVEKDVAREISAFRQVGVYTTVSLTSDGALHAVTVVCLAPARQTASETRVVVMRCLTADGARTDTVTALLLNYLSDVNRMNAHLARGAARPRESGPMRVVHVVQLHVDCKNLSCVRPAAAAFEWMADQKVKHWTVQHVPVPDSARSRAIAEFSEMLMCMEEMWNSGTILRSTDVQSEQMAALEDDMQLAFGLASRGALLEPSEFLGTAAMAMYKSLSTEKLLT